ncbi:MAG TPA: SAM-dependent methyltransferase [Planctomycetes bacterium]|nr:SAM-dependent methyltransferase [Planctomycetota bacterium]
MRTRAGLLACPERSVLACPEHSVAPCPAREDPSVGAVWVVESGQTEQGGDASPTRFADFVRRHSPWGADRSITSNRLDLPLANSARLPIIRAGRRACPLVHGGPPVCDANIADQHPEVGSTSALWRRRFPHRLASAVRRRARRWLRPHRGPAAVEAAWQWLSRRGVGEGVRPSDAAASPCPALTAGCIETALAYGDRQAAQRWSQWLAAIQRPDGAIPGPLAAASPPCTALAVRAWIAATEEMPAMEPPARRAAAYLCRWVTERAGYRSRLGKQPAVWARGVAPALWLAGQRWDRADWLRAARQMATLAADHWSGPISELLRSAEENLTLGRVGLARSALDLVARAQRPSGAVAESTRGGAIRSAVVAQAAALWFRSGLLAAARRAMDFLQRRQDPDGGFAAAWSTLGWAKRPSEQDPWAAKHYLDAARYQVEACFRDAWQALPDQIDPHDGRFQAIVRWMAKLAPRCRVADVGCGTGRFLRHLADLFPQAELTGVDISSAALQRLPPSVTACRASMLRVPLPDATFDGALAVESLEHSLLPERAVAELCRLVKPGGAVLIIDKDRRKQPLSECQPWERWFLPAELARWLQLYCGQVAVHPVSHSEGQPGSDLFLAAWGVRLA